mmetsp:Transcript_68734/g.223792  ORF Transcript_68734/g.223792 Transcript_68734/m.223792 type:complete len:450 (-) Transcript_68734:297-1646(-)
MSWNRSPSVRAGRHLSSSRTLPLTMETFSPLDETLNCRRANSAKNGSRSRATTRPSAGSASARPSAAPPVKVPICRQRLARKVWQRNCRVRTVMAAGAIAPLSACFVSLLAASSCQSTFWVACLSRSQFRLMGLLMCSRYGFNPLHKCKAPCKCSLHVSVLPASKSANAFSNRACIPSIKDDGGCLSGTSATTSAGASARGGVGSTPDCLPGLGIARWLPPEESPGADSDEEQAMVEIDSSEEGGKVCFLPAFAADLVTAACASAPFAASMPPGTTCATVVGAADAESSAETPGMTKGLAEGSKVLASASPPCASALLPIFRRSRWRSLFAARAVEPRPALPWTSASASSSSSVPAQSSSSSICGDPGATDLTAAMTGLDIVAQDIFGSVGSACKIICWTSCAKMRSKSAHVDGGGFTMSAQLCGGSAFHGASLPRVCETAFIMDAASS